MNLCGVRVNRIQEMWLTRQQQRNRREASAMLNAGAKFIERCMMGWRAIAFMAGKAITRKFIVKRHHDPVARHLGDDRSGSDGKAACVTGDNGLNFAGKFRGAVAVNQSIVRRFVEILHRFRHRPHGGGKNIVAVDTEVIPDANANFRRFHKLGVKRFAGFRIEFFGIIQAARNIIGIKHDGSGNHRPRQGPAPSFVDAAYPREPLGARRKFNAEIRFKGIVQGHGPNEP